MPSFKWYPNRSKSFLFVTAIVLAPMFYEKANATIIPTCSNAYEDTASLGDLLYGGGEFLVDDKCLSNWQLTTNESNEGSDTIELDRLFVTGIDSSGDSDPLDPGPGITISDLIYDVLTVEDYEYQDLVFSFMVSVLDPTSYAIKDMSLELTGSEVDSDDDEGEITIDANSLRVYEYVDDEGEDYFYDFFDDIDFTPVSMLQVNVSISLYADDDASADLRSFDIRFSQESLTPDPDIPVPLPGTIALFGLGLAGIGVSWRRIVRR